MVGAGAVVNVNCVEWDAVVMAEMFVVVVKQWNALYHSIVYLRDIELIVTQFQMSLPKMDNNFFFRSNKKAVGFI